MTPLEKAARAACEIDSKLHGWSPDRAMIAQGDRYRDLARAVLEAVREPGEDVVSAANAVLCERGDPVAHPECHAAMIDAILNQKEPK